MSGVIRTEWWAPVMSEGPKRLAQQQLDGLLVEGLGSGPAEPWIKADVDGIRATVREALEKGRRASDITKGLYRQRRLQYLVDRRRRAHRRTAATAFRAACE